MKIARFDGGKVGVVTGDVIKDVSGAARLDPGEWPPVGMLRLIADFGALRPQIERAAAAGARDSPSAGPARNAGSVAEQITRHAGQLRGALQRDGRQRARYPRRLAGRRSGFFHEVQCLADRAGRNDRHTRPSGSSVPSRMRAGGRRRTRWTRHSQGAALDHIFGYACLMDITMRGKGERVMRKSFDTFTPVGPWIVTADEIGAPDDLHLQLWVNGELRQHAYANEMIVGVREQIAMISSVTRLEPGDIIASGTMAGVGPIVPGDSVRIEIDRVGSMTLGVAAAVPATFISA